MILRATHTNRHPELVSGSIPLSVSLACVAQWMLKQVQHDVMNDKMTSQ